MFNQHKQTRTNSDRSVFIKLCYSVQKQTLEFQNGNKNERKCKKMINIRCSNTTKIFGSK